jgi:hypothetical protein
VGCRAGLGVPRRRACRPGAARGEGGAGSGGQGAQWGGAAWRLKEEERGREKKGKRKRRKGKKKTNKKKKENKGRKIENGFRKLGEFLGKIGEGFLWIFLGFSDTGVNSGTAVMARRTGRRDRGGAGFPSWWPTTALGRHAWVMAGCGWCRQDSRHAHRGEKNRPGFRKGVNELSGKVLITRVIYLMIY